MAVKGLSRSGADMIIDERERRGEYKSLADFSSRVKLGRDDIIALCPAGVFDRIAQGIPRTFQARTLLKANTGTAGKGQQDLLAGEPAYRAAEGDSTVIAPVKQKTAAGELWEEYAALGYLLKLHPLALWKDRILSVRRVKAKRIADYLDRYVCLVGWPVTQKEVWTKDGLSMSFLTFEDETAIYETVIFPKVYDQYGKLLFDQMPLLVYGRVKDDHGAITLEVDKVTPL
jgi:DNA polymerase-3 subunit alpha/error-prone DNA polymerase